MPESERGPERHGAIRLEHFRRPFCGKLVDLEPWEKKQIAEILGKKVTEVEAIFDMAETDEMNGEYGIVDVVDAETEDPRYQIHLFGYGDGAMFAHEGTKIVAHICQHGFDPVEDLGKSFEKDLANAWREGARRMRMWEGHIDFA